jgi:hypothetical protein
LLAEPIVVFRETFCSVVSGDWYNLYPKIKCDFVFCSTVFVAWRVYAFFFLSSGQWRQDILRRCWGYCLSRFKTEIILRENQYCFLDLIWLTNDIFQLLLRKNVITVLNSILYPNA